MSRLSQKCIINFFNNLNIEVVFPLRIANIAGIMIKFDGGLIMHFKSANETMAEQIFVFVTFGTNATFAWN